MPARIVPPTRSPSGSRGGVRPPARKGLPGWKKALAGAGLLVVLVAVGIFVYYYVRFSRIIDARLSGDIFNNASLFFSAPTLVFVGEAATPADVATRLRRALYAEGDSGSPVGGYQVSGSRLEVHPGPASFFHGQEAKEGAVALTFREGHIASITALDRSIALDHYLLEPELITTLFDATRSKRRLVCYQDLPKVLVDTVVATEDRQFFSHHGVSFYRIISAALTDLRAEERLQGGSTLTMQLARNIILMNRRRTFRRKVEEIFVAMLLEQRLSKEQIFEMYANQIYLGQRGSFSIYGFGEAASSYFNKDVNSLSLPEAALLAGLIRGPNLYSPYKYPARALERRNTVLRQMLELGTIKSSEAEQASAAPLGVTGQNAEGEQTPYFVDMVKDQLLAQFSERDLLSQSYRIYTTLDPEAQRAASEGVRTGMVEVDQQVKKFKRAKGAPPDSNQPQVALVALDPHTGEIKALVGGRNYGLSQLNHVLAKRQPGSSFKPFVYAAALSSGVDGSQPLITTMTQLDDEPTTFQWGDQTYEPENYKQEYHGMVALREALMFSLNVATVRLAEMVGYDRVRNLAVAAGINKDLLATPALALGAYVATPLEIAGAYTIFSNSGQYVEPRFILAVNDASGRTLWHTPTVTRQVLDPRVAYLMVSLMESVMNNGTAAGVRGRGFNLPAAGKTGTSHDGWFAGFTADLLCVVWVGYDDDRELKLPGASSALPVWTEFMKRATQVAGYQDAKPFEPPVGVVAAPVESKVNPPGGGESLVVRNEYFIQGTEPRVAGAGGGSTGILSRLFHPRGDSTVPAAATPPSAVPPPGTGPAAAPSTTDAAAQQKKGGIMKKFLSIFKGKESKPAAPAESQKKPESPG